MPRAGAGAWDSHWAAQIGLIAAGLVALVFGSDYLVQAAVSFAKTMGVSDVVIGLTIVAAGTSMPEVATSIAAAIKGELTSRSATSSAATPSTSWAAWACRGWCRVTWAWRWHRRCSPSISG